MRQRTADVLNDVPLDGEMSSEDCVRDERRVSVPVPPAAALPSSAPALPAGQLLRMVEASPRAQESVPALVELDLSRCDEVCALEPSCYSHPWSAELIRSEFEKEISYRPALLLDGRVVAYSFNYIVADELHILNLAVAPEARSRGLGSRLLSEILLEGLRRAVECAVLEVRQSNRVAQNLYESFGFKLIGMRRHYYRDNQEHALVLERRFTERDREILPRLASGARGSARN